MLTSEEDNSTKLKQFFDELKKKETYELLTGK